MAKYPAMQKRAQIEIDNELGCRPPSSSDRKILKFTDAIICETFRMSTLVSVAMTRTQQSTTLRGYTIPENSIVIANLHGIHRDPIIWKDPEHFHVENFYDEANASLINLDYLCQFSLGSFHVLKPIFFIQIRIKALDL